MKVLNICLLWFGIMSAVSGFSISGLSLYDAERALSISVENAERAAHFQRWVETVKSQQIQARQKCKLVKKCKLGGTDFYSFIEVGKLTSNINEGANW